MNAVRKIRIKTTLKYTWPFYLVLTVLVILLMNFIFSVTHKTPAYKTLTIFVSGEVTDSKKLKNDLLEKYQEKDLKSVSTISEDPGSPYYYSKLSVTGYNSADILIIPESILTKLTISAFGLKITPELKSDYFTGLTFFSQEDSEYGIKLAKEKVKDYMLFPSEDCYMVINAKSENIGSYSLNETKRDNALTLAKDWGM